jgi:integrase
MEKERKSERTLERERWLLRVLKDEIGHRPIGAIEAPELLDALRKVEARGHHETVVRLRSTASRVFRYGIASGKCKRDPAADLRGALTSPTEKHRAAITDPNGVGALLRAIDAYDGRAATRIALKLLALTFVRPGELRFAEWSEFDLTTAVWSIPPEKMKMREPHRVPLSSQAVALLTELKPITGFGRFLFPALSRADRPMSENTLNWTLRKIGYAGDQMVAHGFRALASTLLNEEKRWPPDVIERQLAHREPNSVRRAYDRAHHWPERVAMMNAWADHLDKLRGYGQVVPLVKPQAASA